MNCEGLAKLLYSFIDKETNLYLVAFRTYKVKGVFVWVVCCLIPSISPWLLNDNNIDVKDIIDLKKWDHNDIARFAHIIL